MKKKAKDLTDDEVASIRKEIDKYMWQLGKKYFLKSYGKKK